MRDLGGVTLLVGVRDNDLKGRSSGDLTMLAGVHGDPDTQQEHCLRNRGQDEPGGSLAALADCRTYIRGRIVEAIDGLDSNSAPDLAKRTSLPVYLSIRGRVNALLPTYYVRMGQAIHAVEDGFTHTYRTADGMKVTVVLNWADEVGGKIDEAHDGPAHAHAMDACDDPDELLTTRRALATDAASRPSSRDARSAQVQGRKVGHGGQHPRYVLQLLARLHLRQPLVRCAREKLQGLPSEALRLLVWRRRGAPGGGRRLARAGGPRAPPEKGDLPSGGVPAREREHPRGRQRACRGTSLSSRGARRRARRDRRALPSASGHGGGAAARPTRSVGGGLGRIPGVLRLVRQAGGRRPARDPPPPEHALDRRVGRGVESLALALRPQDHDARGPQHLRYARSSGFPWPTRTSTCDRP